MNPGNRRKQLTLTEHISFRTLLMSFVLLLITSLSTTSVSAHNYRDNGVFLTHDYVEYSSYVALVTNLSYKMDVNYHTHFWFNNISILTSSGTIPNPSTELAQVKNYLNAVKSYEGSAKVFIPARPILPARLSSLI
jgi:hypothetical protein